MKKEEKILKAIQKGYTYNPETGDIIRPNGNITCSKSLGYITINFRIGNKCYRLFGHQFAYYIYYGWCPEIIDHINRDRSDNRMSNLREASYSINNRNVKSKGTRPRGKKWTSQIVINYKSIHLGTFNTEQEAKNAYLEAKKKYHPEYAQ